jgi:hypothetical protein
LCCGAAKNGVLNNYWRAAVNLDCTWAVRTEPMCLQKRVTWSKINIFASCCIVIQSQHSVVPTVTSLGVARPRNRVSIPVAGLVFSLFQNVRTSTGSLPVSYSIDNGGRFLGVKGDQA